MFGTNVVKWYSAVFALTPETALINVDFPTLGVHIKATSARSCNSKINSFFSQGSPKSAIVGNWFCAFLKWIFPRPPFPHFTQIQVWLSSCKCAITFQVAASFINVPIGTNNSIFSASDPYLSLDIPGLPGFAVNIFLYLYCINVRSSLHARKMMEPPLPPSHPAGPHRGTFASRLPATLPSPPFPDCIVMVTWS